MLDDLYILETLQRRSNSYRHRILSSSDIYDPLPSRYYLSINTVIGLEASGDIRTFAFAVQHGQRNGDVSAQVCGSFVNSVSCNRRAIGGKSAECRLCDA